MNEQTLAQALRTEVFGRPLFFFEEVDSTNSEAMRRLGRGSIPSGSVLVAARQSAGRGTGANAWLSDQPEGLWFSLVLEGPLRFNPIQFLPAIALADVLRTRYGVPAHVKWPNDVLVETKKISGTLIESHARSGETNYVIGIGLNVNQTRFPETIAARAISLRQATGGLQPLSLETVFGDVMGSLEDWYQRPSDPIAAWLERTRMVGRTLRIKRPGGQQLALCTGLGPTGALLLRHDDGTSEELVSYTTTDIDFSYAADDAAPPDLLPRRS